MCGYGDGVCGMCGCVGCVDVWVWMWRIGTNFNRLLNPSFVQT